MLLLEPGADTTVVNGNGQTTRRSLMTKKSETCLKVNITDLTRDSIYLHYSHGPGYK